MTPDEVKFILQAYRAGTEDDNDPRFQEALAHVEKDAELAAWFAEQQEFDGIVRDRLREIEVPADLKQRILAGRKVVQMPPRNYSRELIGLAAVLLIFAAGIFYFNGPSGDAARNRLALGASWQASMVHRLDTGYQLNLRESDPAKVRAWLAEHSPVNVEGLPAVLDGHSSHGCETFTWNGREVVLACFNMNGEIVHVFMMDHADLPDDDHRHWPAGSEAGRWATDYWCDHKTEFLVATSGGREILQALR